MLYTSKIIFKLIDRKKLTGADDMNLDSIKELIMRLILRGSRIEGEALINRVEFLATPRKRFDNNLFVNMSRTNCASFIHLSDY